MNFFKKKIGIPVVFALVITASTISYLVSRQLPKMKQSDSTIVDSNHRQTNVSNLSNPGNIASCNYNVKRLGGFHLIRPILYIENECESHEFDTIKTNVNQLIEGYKQNHIIHSASVYFREISSGEWFAINKEEKYKPGSLMKIPVLIAFLKMQEHTPELLNKKISFDTPLTSTKVPITVSKSIQLGHTYTVRELLTYMIEYSDNNASFLLLKHIDSEIFKKIFTDFGLQHIDPQASDYPISSKDFSVFMRILFNSSYLTNEHSEFAMELLTKSDFKEGILKDLPKSVLAAHKFGESGSEGAIELHETAIIYLNASPYLLTIMTKGADISQQYDVLASISKEVYAGLQPVTPKS